MNPEAPPNPSRAIGSRLYPREALPQGTVHEVANQLREEALARQYNEQKAYLNAKHPQYEEFRHYYRFAHNICEICSEYTNRLRNELAPIYHFHHSSLQYRIKASSDRWGHYFCPTCIDGFHSLKVGVRYPLLVTSSTLSNWRGRPDVNGYLGDVLHMDEICISGARVRDLRHAFEAEYGALHRPVDVVLVAGLNNILEGQDAGRIMFEIAEFHSRVKNIAGSSFAVCTLPFPPSMSILPDDQHHRVKREATETLTISSENIVLRTRTVQWT